MALSEEQQKEVALVTDEKGRVVVRAAEAPSFNKQKKGSKKGAKKNPCCKEASDPVTSHVDGLSDR